VLPVSVCPLPTDARIPRPAVRSGRRFQARARLRPGRHGGASGQDDFSHAIATAVINKRAGGTGLISGRKVFQRPIQEGIALLNAIQDVYLSPEVDIP